MRRSGMGMEREEREADRRMNESNQDGIEKDGKESMEIFVYAIFLENPSPPFFRTYLFSLTFLLLLPLSSPSLFFALTSYSV